MDALQADASTIPDDSVDHVANALANMQVTAPAAASVPASTPVDPADRSAAAEIWPSLLSRRTRSHWLTCPRCTVPWTIPAARNSLTSSVKR
jgi:hypothetical protein